MEVHEIGVAQLAYCSSLNVFMRRLLAYSVKPLVSYECNLWPKWSGSNWLSLATKFMTASTMSSHCVVSIWKMVQQHTGFLWQIKMSAVISHRKAGGFYDSIRTRSSIHHRNVFPVAVPVAVTEKILRAVQGFPTSRVKTEAEIGASNVHTLSHVLSVTRTHTASPQRYIFKAGTL